ncbi:MAG: bifunctional diguanylate cyclase/phosphodiesterase, partial [Planctomycetes bacterium]|nr:bifunctional diguanylate cyclase/phosphodiesterase [Planctomycetota bacterium]
SIARVFRASVHEPDMVARFGGDEFVVLLDRLSEWSESEEKAARLLHGFAAPHDVAGHRIVSTASIGLVTNEHAHQSAADMLRDADAAMYRAKEDGGARVVQFDRAMHERAMSRQSLESSLRFALEDNQLRLVYQPIVSLETGTVSGFEALLRWDHPDRGVVSPVDFIPIAEETGMIIGIGRWVLRTACRQIADWNRRLGLEAKLSINVNISRRQLMDSALIDDVLECLRENDLSAEELKLEITESMISDERFDVIPLLAELRERGVQIVLDDFGTGVSSLSALHSYPIDVLKIDQSFVRSLDGDRSLLAVVASITALAGNLGITTVAEGIEMEDTIGALQSIDCTWGQGYYFAQPMTPVDAEAYLLGIQKERCGA